jgi:hypothetical protein
MKIASISGVVGEKEWLEKLRKEMLDRNCTTIIATSIDRIVRSPEAFKTLLGDFSLITVLNCSASNSSDIVIRPQKNICNKPFLSIVQKHHAFVERLGKGTFHQFGMIGRDVARYKDPIPEQARILGEFNEGSFGNILKKVEHHLGIKPKFVLIQQQPLNHAIRVQKNHNNQKKKQVWKACQILGCNSDAKEGQTCRKQPHIDEFYRDIGQLCPLCEKHYMKKDSKRGMCLACHNRAKYYRKKAKEAENKAKVLLIYISISINS